MNLYRRLTDNLSIDLMRQRFVGGFFSLALTVFSVVMLFINGLNFGIDFKGGIAMELSDTTAINVADVREKLNELGLGEVAVQEFGAPTDILVRVQQQAKNNSDADAAQQEAVVKVKEAVVQTLGNDVEFRRVEVVGPTVGGELIRKGIYAVIFSMIGIMGYIWLRFEWQFGVGVMLALLHDVLTTLGLFAVTQINFDLATVAAILTVAGYSLNDTVVIFDRIRENLRKYRKMPLIELLNKSTNETLSRTFLTSISTMLALLSLYLFGGEVIASFTIALMWGIFVGTYSSVYVATPALIYLKLRNKKEQD